MQSQQFAHCKSNTVLVLEGIYLKNLLHTVVVVVTNAQTIQLFFDNMYTHTKENRSEKENVQKGPVMIIEAEIELLLQVVAFPYENYTRILYPSKNLCGRDLQTNSIKELSCKLKKKIAQLMINSSTLPKHKYLHLHLMPVSSKQQQT